MDDQDDDGTIEHESESGEQPTPATPADVYGGVLALIGMIQNPRAFKSKLKEFRQAEAAANKAAADLVTAQAAQAAHEQHCASERAAIAARAEAVSKAEVELVARMPPARLKMRGATSWRAITSKRGFSPPNLGPL
jgi:hypothetical protein